MPYWDDDLAALVSLDTPGSVTATFGSLTAKGPLDLRDEIRFGTDGRETVVRVRVLTLRNSDFSTLAVNDSVTIDSVTYKVRDIQRVGDGATKEVLLATVTT